MAIRGIGIEGVASEIGALSRQDFVVKRHILVKGLCRRFQASLEEVEDALTKAQRANVIRAVGDNIHLVTDSDTWEDKVARCKQAVQDLAAYRERLNTVLEELMKAQSQ